MTIQRERSTATSLATLRHRLALQAAPSIMPLAAWMKQAVAALERAREQDVNQAFAVAGSLPDMPLAAVTDWQVQGFPGTLGMPLPANEVERLVALAQPAPFGRNADTVLDPAVRKALQIDAALVTSGETWKTELQKLTSRVAAELGVDPQVTVEARPYKLLMYQKGGHFKAHKDTEKEAGMFGTLVVQLPVRGGHKGGELAFQHHGKKFEWQTETNSNNTFQYAAFYADVEHQLRPVTLGTRVVMVYNLVRTGGGVVPAALDGSLVVQQVQKAVTSWEQDLAKLKPSTPRFLCVLLDHQYTESSLSFSALKGTDAKMVGCLNHPESGLDVHLALLSRTETHDDGSFDSGFQDTTFDVESCISAVGTKPHKAVMRHIGLSKQSWDEDIPAPQLLGGGRVPVWGDDWVGEGYSGDEDGDGDGDEELVRRQPDKRVHNPYTGNDGATIDKIYHDAVAVIWPKAPSLALFGGLLEPTLYLLELRHAQGDTGGVETAVQEVVTLFKRPVREDEDGQVSFQHLGSEEDITAALQAVGKLDADVAVPALATIIAHLPTVGNVPDTWDRSSEKLRLAIMDCIIKHGTPAELVKATTRLVAAHVKAHVAACVRLALAASQKSTELGSAVTGAILQKTLLATSAKKILASLPEDHVCNLVVMLCQVPGHEQHLDKLVTIILALPDPQPLLEELVKLDEVLTAASGLPAPLKRLAEARQKYLKQLLKPVPRFTWAMPDASVPEYPEMEAFLRGPKEAASFPVNSYSEAEKLTRGYFTKTLKYDEHSWGVDEYDARYMCYSFPSQRKRQRREPTYTAKASIGSTSLSVTMVAVTKTRSWHEHLVNEHKAEQQTIEEDLAAAEKLLMACGNAPPSERQKEKAEGKGRGRGTASGKGKGTGKARR